LVSPSKWCKIVKVCADTPQASAKLIATAPQILNKGGTPFPGMLTPRRILSLDHIGSSLQS
jgi:hypothetical protein